MHLLFVEKLNSELSTENETIEMCDFCDGVHDDLGEYLLDYHDKLDKVWY